jgi:hypothetical protein
MFASSKILTSHRSVSRWCTHLTDQEVKRSIIAKASALKTLEDCRLVRIMVCYTNFSRFNHWIIELH